MFLVGGAAALTRFARDSKAEAIGSGLAPAQFTLLELVSDVMIPATETPGALAAGVPAFVREMLEQWASSATRAELAGRARRHRKKRVGPSRHDLQPAAAGAAPRGAARIRRRRDARGDESYGKFKSLVLAGYYHSEIGATRELRYEMVPGTWRSCLPFNEIGRASAV